MDTTRKYGWKRDTHDTRDFMYAPMPMVLPPKVDLRPSCPPVLSQDQLGSCTSNALASSHHFDQIKQNILNQMDPARLMIYYNERAMEGTINEDSGAMLRDGIKTLATYGVCSETMWPYDVSQFTVKPTPACYESALNYKIVQYQRLVQSLVSFKTCLAQGYPFVFGFSVYASFEGDTVAKTGVMTMPEPNEECLGGHAVMCVGYDDARQCFIIMNSWGSSWGDQGFFYMPYEYMTRTDLANDFWTIRLMVQPVPTTLPTMHVDVPQVCAQSDRDVCSDICSGDDQYSGG